ncbi:hypothetical protein [Bacillus cereus]|uniref:hypothetical protein n=1 Tax=Bacillus cereus TaxID=1396 RepID=UPI001CEF84BF|nr:hypothetical protein [Bacillus cereus]
MENAKGLSITNLNFVEKWGIKVKDVKIENVCGSLRIFVDGTVIGKVVTENLLINLDQAGAINLTIEN